MRFLIPTIGSRGDVQPFIALALAELTHNPRFRQSAASLSQQIRLENGIENAVSLIEATFC
ncbi:MAG TPA: hypothetical protein VLA49_11105 [Anaerolineales bacterium]|nr:hypothetical protein [Anaerolineales bacterium]